jgi:hypothetical protein
MVALVGSVEDASQYSNHYSEEWTPEMMNRFVKRNRNLGNKKVRNFKISKCIEQFNNNAMNVFVGSVDIANDTRTGVNEPQKTRKVEAFRKKKVELKK